MNEKPTTTVKTQKTKQLPLKLILNEKGMHFFVQHGQKMSSFRPPNGGTEYGFLLKNFDLKAVLDILERDFISRIDISCIEMGAVRDRMMNFIKLIAYEMFYRQFSTEVYQNILKSELIRKWNRENPKQVIDEKSSLNENVIRRLLQERNQEVESLKKGFLDRMVNDYGTTTLNPMSTQGKRGTAFLKRLVHRLNPFSLFFMLQYGQNNRICAVERRIHEYLTEYMRKIDIPEYIALVLVELMEQLVKINLIKAADELYNNTYNLEELLARPVIREKFINYLYDNDVTVSISFRLETRQGGYGLQNRLHVILYNRSSEYKNMSTLIHRQMHTRTYNTTLFTFYEQILGSSRERELGFFYLSYMKEMCDKHGIRFDSFVNHISDGNLTVIHLNFDF